MNTKNYGTCWMAGRESPNRTRGKSAFRTSTRNPEPGITCGRRFSLSTECTNCTMKRSADGERGTESTPCLV